MSLQQTADQAFAIVDCRLARPIVVDRKLGGHSTTGSASLASSAYLNDDQIDVWIEDRQVALQSRRSETFA